MLVQQPAVRISHADTRCAAPPCTQGQLAVFAGQLAPTAPAAAAACRAAAGAPEPPAPQCPPAPPGPLPAVTLSACYTYQVPPPPPQPAAAAAEGWGGEGAWDADAPWVPWASELDPISCLELDIVWEGLPVSQHARQGGDGPAPAPPAAGGAGAARGPAPGPHAALDPAWPPGLRPSSAGHWVVHALGRGRGFSEAQGRGLLGLGATERCRHHCELRRGRGGAGVLAEVRPLRAPAAARPACGPMAPMLPLLLLACPPHT